MSNTTKTTVTTTGEVHIFTEADKEVQFAVKTEFLKKCNNPQDFDAYNLLTKYQLAKFLHNPGGPAIVLLKSPEKAEYWLDGKKLSEEEGRKMAHNHEFNDRFVKTLTNDSV